MNNLEERGPINLTTGSKLPKHPDYKYDDQCRKFWGLSFEGGPKYKNGRDCDGKPILIKHEQESDAGYERRKCMATARNYVKPILSKYNRFIFTTPVKRDDSSKPFEEFRQNADMLGTKLEDLMQRASLKAEIFKSAFLLVESSKTGEQTEAQARAAGNRIFVIEVEPHFVLDWREKSGQLTEALIHFPADNLARLYTKNTVSIATLGKDDEITGLEVIDNPWDDQLPVVRLASTCIVSDLAEVNKGLFNLDALLREELNKQTFTQYIATGIDAESFEEAAATFASRKITCIPNPDVTFNRLAADASQALQIRDSISDDIKELFRIAGLQNPDVVQGTESGRALKIRFNEVALMAAAIADNAEKAENKVIKLLETGLGVGDIQPTDYPEEFDVEALAEQLEMTLKLDASDMPAILRNKQTERLFSNMFPNATAEEKRQFLEQIKEIEEGMAEQQQAGLSVLRPMGPEANQDQQTA